MLISRCATAKSVMRCHARSIDTLDVLYQHFIMRLLRMHALVHSLCEGVTASGLAIATFAVQILTEDYSKAALLLENRTIEFHTRKGRHFTTHVPKAGRDLAYLPNLAELVIAGSAPEIWRISLYEGRFMPPLPSAIDGINALGVCPSHGMLAAAGEGGLLECFDPRAKGSLGATSAAAAMGFANEALTALRFDASGMHIAVGTSGVCYTCCKHPTWW